MCNVVSALIGFKILYKKNMYIHNHIIQITMKDAHMLLWLGKGGCGYLPTDGAQAGLWDTLDGQKPAKWRKALGK